MLSPKELTEELGFVPHEIAVSRFRIHWRDFIVKQLPMLERNGQLSHGQALGVMTSAIIPVTKWAHDKPVRAARLLWFCDHILNHTNLPLTNRVINKLVFGKDSRTLHTPSFIGLIRSYREEQMKIVLKALERLPTGEIVDGPSPRAGELLERISRIWVPKLGIPPRIDPKPLMTKIFDYIVEVKHVVPTYHGLHDILPFVPQANNKGSGFMSQLKEWRLSKGYPGALRGAMNPALPRSWDALIPTLDKAVQTAPHTYLDPRARHGRYPRFSDDYAARVGRSLDKNIRSAVALGVLNSCGNMNELSSFATGLKQILEAGRLNGVSDPRMEDTLRAFVTGDLEVDNLDDDSDEPEDEEMEGRDSGGDEDDEGTAWSKNKIRDFFRVYRAISFAHQRYLQDLPPNSRSQFKHLIIPQLQDQVFWKAANFNYIVEEQTRKRRKARTDALFPYRGEIRITPDFRTNQAKRILVAFRAEVESIKTKNLPLPHRFALLEDEPHLGPPTEHRFVIWSRATLNKKHRKSARWSRPDLERFRFKGPDLFVEYLGPVAKDGKPSTNQLWFTDIVRYNICHPKSLRDQKSEEMRRSYGITSSQYKPVWSWLCASRALSGALCNLIRDVREKNKSFRPVYFHPEGLVSVCLQGRAANRALNITGCRINELQQVHASPECLIAVTVDKRSEPAYAFMAIPKLRKELDAFYIDDICLNYFHELSAWTADVRTEKHIPHVGGASNLAPHKREKTRPYLFQGLIGPAKALRAGHIGALIRFMLHGLVFTTIDKRTFQPGPHDLRHLTGTWLRSQGVPIDVIAKILKQKNFQVTEYYSEPTATQVITAMHGLRMAKVGVGPPAGVRTLAELQQQLDDANGQVGALTAVNGGTCTVASACPVKFSCVGCAGLVPDYKQRSEVSRNKKRAQEDLTHHAKAGKLAEVRKSEHQINDCDRVLAEMDLQEAADKDARRKPKIK